LGRPELRWDEVSGVTSEEAVFMKMRMLDAGAEYADF
jgi:hypothetical protein